MENLWLNNTKIKLVNGFKSRLEGTEEAAANDRAIEIIQTGQ